MAVAAIAKAEVMMVRAPGVRTMARIVVVTVLEAVVMAAELEPRERVEQGVMRAVPKVVALQVVTMVEEG